MKRQLTRLSPHQNGKVAGVLLGVVSLPMLIVVHLLMEFTAPTAGQSSYPLDFPFFMYLLFPVIYFVIGYTTVAFACLVYNVLHRYIGGFEFELREGSAHGPALRGGRQKAVELAKFLAIPTVLFGITAFLVDQSGAMLRNPEEEDAPVAAAQDSSIAPEVDCGSINGLSLPCWEDYLSDNGFEGRESLPYYPYAKRPNGCSFPEATPGTSDLINVAGITISFTDICNEHDRCYYTPGTTPWECNRLFQNGLRARCVYEFANQPLNAYDVLTLGLSREEAQILCNAEAMLIAGAAIGAQDYSHQLAQDREQDYLARVDRFVRENMAAR